MIQKIIFTLIWMLVAFFGVGVILGSALGYKHRGDRFVIPGILIAWGIIIYLIWF
jgi:hypothetical protein